MQNIRNSVSRFALQKEGIDADTEHARYSLDFLDRLYKKSVPLNLLENFRTMESKVVVCTVCEEDEKLCLCHKGYRDLGEALIASANAESCLSHDPDNLESELKMAQQAIESTGSPEKSKELEFDILLSDEEIEDEAQCSDDEGSEIHLNLPTDVSESHTRDIISDLRKVAQQENLILESTLESNREGRGKKTSFDLPVAEGRSDDDYDDNHDSQEQREEGATQQSCIARLIENMEASNWKTPFDLFSSRSDKEIVYATILVLMNK